MAWSLAIARGATAAQWRADLPALRDRGLVGVGAGGAVSSVVTQFFGLLPLGSQAERAAAGSALAGLIAYGLSRWLGRPLALRLAGETGLRQGESFFATGGAWLVACSRCLPILPEAVACLAGLNRMPFRIFLLAVLCGSLPMGFVFAAIGALGQDEPAWALVLSIVVPALLWLGARRWMLR